MVEEELRDPSQLDESFDIADREDGRVAQPGTTAAA
jgi:hypothetical protein